MRLLNLTRGFFSFLLVAICISPITQAQPKKFGEINSYDFTSYNPEYDSTSSAIVLFVKGDVEFDSDYNCILVFHKRIKILNDSGLEYGDVEILFDKEIGQSVNNIKASTYRLQADGKIKSTKLGSRDVFESEIRKDLFMKKFTLPDVSSGDIIEYTYKKNLGNPFYLPDWKFHDYIPVQWSEIDMIIPSSLSYQMIFKGRDSLHINNVVKLAKLSNNVRAQRFQFAKKELPPVEDLPFLINRDDHVSELLTQLSSVNIPGSLKRNYFRSWESIAKELNERQDFGKQRPDGDIKDKVAELIADKTSELDKMESIYNYLVQNFEWNGSYRLTTEKGIRDTFKDKKGSTGDLNFLLIEMLREAKIKASPGLLSTRDNGSVLTNFPLITQFNMVIAVLEIENSAFSIDISLGARSYQFPHPKILYRNVFVIREDDSYGWLTSYPLSKTYQRISMNYSLVDSSKIDMTIEGRLNGAYSEQIRQDVKSINFNSYWEDEYEDLPCILVDSSSFENLEDLSKSINYTIQLSFDKDKSFALDQELIYFQPFLFRKLEENPFKKETREFPVEFAYPFSDQLMIRIEIPDGFLVDELPETVRIQLPDGNGYYSFMSSLSGNTLTFVSTTNIESIYYGPEYYSSLKELYQAKVDATNTTVVLKKESSE